MAAEFIMVTETAYMTSGDFLKKELVPLGVLCGAASLRSAGHTRPLYVKFMQLQG